MPKGAILNSQSAIHNKGPIQQSELAAGKIN